MADLNLKPMKPTQSWPTFTEEQTVVGWKLLKFADWVVRSKRVLADRTDPGLMPIIALPPVQRSAVWRPKQVLDLWDSLMRGLPIGTFYLVSQPAHPPRQVVLLDTNETTEVTAMGFDLLDGQQRVRALLVGIDGPDDEKRCLWVDFGATTTGRSPALRLTSKAQPFGYDAGTGAKLHLDQRRRARLKIEPDPKCHPLQHAEAAGALRRAYDLELFENDVIQDGKRLSPQPPLPFGASEGQAFQLHKLLTAWRKSSYHSADEGIAALRHITGNAPVSDESLHILHDAFCNLESAQIALLKIDPSSFRSESQDLLALFDRVGAAGTPLSREERLYSTYKHYEPGIRNTVDVIYGETGRVLPPTKIVGTALRIANALTNERQNNIPDPIQFVEAMTGDPKSMFRMKLTELLPGASNALSDNSKSLSQGFATVKSLLSYKDGAGSFWLPDVLLTMLPAELWQVLVLWATIYPKAANWEFSRQEAVRFALFWRLCVLNDEKAANTAFSFLKEPTADHPDFPGAALYQRLIGINRSERLALDLISADEFERKLCAPGESSAWRTYEERFVESKIPNEIGSSWWWHGRRMLPWLQRDYIREAFPEYVPLSEHEDDLPYDFDHICPYKDWGEWVSVRGRLGGVEEPLKQKMRDGRDAVGNGIGNLRIVDSSINKHDQDVDISEKMPFAIADDVSDADRREMAKSAFPPEHRALWKRVSRPGAVGEGNGISTGLLHSNKLLSREQRGFTVDSTKTLAIMLGPRRIPKAIAGSKYSCAAF